MGMIKGSQRLTSRFLAFSLAVGLPTAAIGTARGEAFTNLYRFTALNTQFLNSDGAYPAAGLVLFSNTLYGTASQGGNAGGGTVFKVNSDGTGFRSIYAFTPSNPNTGAPGDGAYPLGGLVLAENSVYGTTSAGGVSSDGIIFRFNIDGTGFTTLHAFSASDPVSFANNDGAFPWAGLVLSGNVLYGTATRGGDVGSGTVFRLNNDGTGFTRLHSFSALDSVTFTNTEGAYPLGGLAISNSTLYGTTYRGGSLGTGTIFRVNTDGTGFTVLQNSDGGSRAGLILSSNVLYGSTEDGGILGGGTVFSLNTDGTGFTNLLTFAGGAGTGPWASLVLASNTLYGTTYSQGDFAQGSVFSVNTDGSGFASIHSFEGGMDGALPQGSVIVSAGTLYGTTSEGGVSGDGTVFGVSLGQTQSQQLSISLLPGKVVLMWPANITGLTLKSAPTLVPPVVWTSVTPGPVIVNGENSVTNAISGAQMFYLLSQ